MHASRSESVFSNFFHDQNLQDDIEEYYEQAGCGSNTQKLGYYQTITLVIMVLNTFFGRIFFLGIPFYTKKPEYLCNYFGELENRWVHCRKFSDACELNQGHNTVRSLIVNYNNPESFKSLYE